MFASARIFERPTSRSGFGSPVVPRSFQESRLAGKSTGVRRPQLQPPGLFPMFLPVRNLRPRTSHLQPPDLNFQPRTSNLRPLEPSLQPLDTLSPLELTLTKNALASLLECTLTKLLDLKFFRINSYEKKGGGGPPASFGGPLAPHANHGAQRTPRASSRVPVLQCRGHEPSQAARARRGCARRHQR
jgi:hypothetical protein